MSQNMPSLLPYDTSHVTYMTPSVSPWSRQSPRPSQYHRKHQRDQYQCDQHQRDQHKHSTTVKAVAVQMQLVRRIQQLLSKEKQKLLLMNKQLRAGNMELERREDKNRICIEDLVVEELNKRMARDQN